MKYNFDKVQDADFCCETCFLDEFMQEFEKLDPDDHSFITVVANGGLAQFLFRELSEVRCECGEYAFHFGFVDFNNYDYGDEYFVSLSSDGSLSIEPVVKDGRYYFTEGEIIFIHEDCNYRVIERLNDGENNIVIFGFDVEE